jgi:glycosyltransferase involved in cell wall biosynthesis
MKVLQLCNKPPFPAIDGGCIAIKNISLGLLENNVDLKILTIETHKHPFIRNAYPDWFLEKTKIESVFIDTKINIIDAFSALVTSDSYNISRFYSPDFDNKLKITLEEAKFDVIHLESLFMTPYLETINKYSDAKVILRSHNLEHIIWERLAKTEKNIAKKIYLNHLAKQLKKYEKQIINQLDGIATISQEDTKRFKKLKLDKKIVTIPFGINIDDYKTAIYKPKDKLRLFHIGAMDWLPNLQAVEWFLETVFPELNSNLIELHIAGKNMPSHLINKNINNLYVHNSVENAIEFMSNYDVMVVPLLSGSGIRIKVIEAMGLAKTVVSTKVGVEGIEVTHNKDILIANSPKEFIEEINKLEKNNLLINQIGENAKKLIVDCYDNKKIINNLIQFYKSV